MSYNKRHKLVNHTFFCGEHNKHAQYHELRYTRNLPWRGIIKSYTKNCIKKNPYLSQNIDEIFI